MALNTVTEAIIVSQLLYAAAGCWGYVTAADRHILERFLAKTVQMGYLCCGLVQQRTVFSRSLSRDNVQQRLFPPPIQRHYDVGPQAHGFERPCRR